MATEITTTGNTSMAPSKKRLFNALNTAESLNDADIKQLTLSGIIVQPMERLDKATGEVVVCEGTTFITEQGAYFSQSDGIARCAKSLIVAYDSDFVSEFTERKLGGGRTMKQFIVL